MAKVFVQLRARVLPQKLTCDWKQSMRPHGVYLGWTERCGHPGTYGRSNILPNGINASDISTMRRQMSSWSSEDLIGIESSSTRESTRNTKRFSNFLSETERRLPSRNQWRKNRRENYDGGLDVVFGTNPVLLALRAQKRHISRLWITEAKSSSQEAHTKEILKLASELRIPVRKEQAAALKRMSGDRPHQGVCLECSSISPEVLSLEKLHHILSEPGPGSKLWVMLDNIHDPMNMGAILRSAYFFGADRILLLEGDSCPLSATVSKASAGILEIIPIHLVPFRNVVSLFEVMCDQSWSIVGTASKKEADTLRKPQKCVLKDLNNSGSILVILGNENKGVNPAVLEVCHKVVTIEPGKRNLVEGADCLNVSVSAGVILSHIASLR